MERARHKKLRLLQYSLSDLQKRKRNWRMEQEAKVQTQRKARTSQMKVMTTMVQTVRMMIATMKAKPPSRKP